jgi:hypothetical protein
MAGEPKRSEKGRDANGSREGRAATEALARDTAAQAAATETAKAATESIVSTAKREAESGVELVEKVATATAHAPSEAAKTAETVVASATEQAAGTASKVAEDTTQAAKDAADVSRKAADAAGEMFQDGMRLAADWRKRFSAFGAGEQLVGTAARMIDIYKGASEDTSANARALARTYVQMGRGMQGLQKTYVELLERASRRAASRPLEFLRCRSVEEFAQVQRDMYVDSLNYSLEATGTLLEAAGAVAQDALKSLHERTQASA